MPSTHHWRRLICLVWSKSVGGTNSYDHYIHCVNCLHTTINCMDDWGGVRLNDPDEEITAATPTAQTTSSTTTTTPCFLHPHSSSSSDSEDEEEEDDGSTSTVVHNDCPPNATKDEINKLYWEWCYGFLSSSSSSSSSSSTTTTIPTVVVIEDSEGAIGVTTGSSYSGSRREGLLPGKSCLSTSSRDKDDIMPTTKKSISREDSITPRRLHLIPLLTTTMTTKC